MFKKFLVVAFIASVALPVFVAAQTTDSQSIAELEQMVRGLIKQVEELQARLYSQLEQISVPPSNSGPGGSGGASSSPGIAVSQCVRLSRGLYLGTSDKETGSEVSVLQKYLKFTGDYDYPEITGYFGPATERAVKSFQSRNGIVTQGDAESTGFGVIGPSTRSAIAKGCVVPTQVPNVGQFTPTIPLVITTTSVPSSIQPPMVISIDSQNPGAGLSPSQNASISMSYMSDDINDYAGSWGIFRADGTKDFHWAIKLTLNAQKTIKSILQITDQRGSAGFTSASYVDGKQLYPIVVFKNGIQLNTAYDQSLGTYDVGTYSFDVFGQNAGSLKFGKFGIVVYFTDGTYAMATTNGNVTTSSTPSITVISPNGGSYSQLNPLNISWTPYSGDFDYYYLFLGNKLAGGSSLSPNQNISKINVSFTANNLSEVIKEIIANSGGKTAEQIKDSYYIEIDAVKNDRVGGSIIYRTFSVPFTITSDISQPSITVISPNGGEVFARDSRLNVSWRSDPIPSSSSMARVELRKGSWGGQVVLYSEVANTGSASLPISAYFLTGTDYKIRVSDTANSAVYDESNSYFTIANATTTAITSSNTGTQGNEENLDQMAGVIQSLWDVLAKLSAFLN